MVPSPSSPGSTTMPPTDDQSVPMRRSRRLAEKHGWASSEVVMPSTPRLVSSQSTFEGPTPTWSTGHAPRPATPSSPIRTADMYEPRTLPPLSHHTFTTCPQSPGLTGLGVQLSRRHTRHQSEAQTRQDDTVLLPSVRSSPRLGAEDWPTNESLVPATPKVGVVAEGVFPSMVLPDSITTLVPPEDPEADVPVRRVSPRMARSATMRRSNAKPLDAMPQSSHVQGLGVSVFRDDKQPSISHNSDTVRAPIKKGTDSHAATPSSTPRLAFQEKAVNEVAATPFASSKTLPPTFTPSSVASYCDENGHIVPTTPAYVADAVKRSSTPKSDLSPLPLSQASTDAPSRRSYYLR
ncbi:hypothetical protein Malapachy_3932 [Malassezia pachydermatis]|uniref:Uncharacterized protein n=1 Tax=Malassezia pachydermatis TaxID=77020 RepID=A0A0M9VP42_9BASI|nr:hypothetical protein Malapachy_3932 [Malassezia pachydermatis]KOS14042.1 hypothetical protein Malapachy_3932 [Malassezia pachydermatis]